MKKYIEIALAVVLVIIGGWYITRHKSAPPPSTPVPSPAPAPSPSGGELTDGYSNSKMGFSLLIPTKFTVDESYKYSMNPGVIIDGVKFTIPSYVADGTNLGHDTYISVETMPQTGQCSAGKYLDGTHLAQTYTKNGVIYSAAAAEGAGAGNRYHEIVYALPSTNPCLAVRYFIHYSVIQNYPEGSVTEFDMDALLAQFDKIRDSLKVNQPTAGAAVSVNPSVTSATVVAPVTIATGFDIPWELVFLPGGDMLVTERPGTLLRIGADRREIEVSGVTHNGEGGLLGLALDPKFSQNGLIYLYMTTSSGGGLTNRVERYKLDGTTLSDRKVIIEGIPGASNHDGGRIAFGKDGLLYITTGDAGNEDNAQDTNNLAGKILRVRSDGSIPSDNQFGNAVYSYGHRNVQGIAWDNSGQLWATEHGRSSPSGYDELNKIVKGANYGWPEIQGNETKSGMLTPQLNSGASETWAPSGMAYLRGHLIYAGLKGESLYVTDISTGVAKNLKKYLIGVYGRLRTVTLGPDGMLYILTNNRDGRGNPVSSDDRIIKIDPKTLGL